MKKVLTSVAIVMFTLAVPEIVHAATVGTATANPSLNLRQSATTSSAVLSGIPKNTQVNVLSKNGSNWYNVVYNGKTGWVSGQYLIVKDTGAPTVASDLTKTVGTATANPSLNLRASATTSAAVLAAIPKNTQVIVLSKNGSNWYNVTYNGKTGWVAGQYLSIKNTGAPVTLVSHTQPSRSDSSELVNNALSLQGVPYVWGGTSRSGFDCSGFAQYVFKESGIDLPRISYDQYRVGSSVDRAQLQAGDLVFFSTYAAGASHVGIYIGGGRFIGAANTGVIISDLNSGYYSSRYLGARRVR